MRERRIGMSTEAAYHSVFALAGGFLLLGALFVFKVQKSRPQSLLPAIN